MSDNEDGFKRLVNDFAESLRFTNEGDKERFRSWISVSFDKVKDEMGKGLVPIPYIVNYHKSPWLSLRFVERDVMKKSLENRQPISYFSACLFFMPDYMSPIPPEIKMAWFSEEDPEKTSQKLAALDMRSWVYNDLLEVRKDIGLTAKQKLKKCIDILVPPTRIGGVLDPRREWDINLWHFAANFLLELNRDDLAFDLYLALLNHIISIQTETKPIYKGEILSVLGHLCFRRNDLKNAERHFIEAAIEDLIHKRDAESRRPLLALRNLFGFTDMEFEELRKLTNAAPSKANPRGVYSEFKTKETSLKMQHLFDTWVDIDTGKAKELFENVQKAETNDQKKKTLEEMAEYIFSCVEGFEVLKSKRTATGEIDRTIRNNRTDHPLFISIGPYFILEAKNWDKKAGAQEIIVLIQKIQAADLNLGVAVTKEGITGDIDKDARRVIHDGFISHKVTTVVFDAKDLEQIVEGHNLLEMLQEKMEKVRFSELG